MAVAWSRVAARTKNIAIKLGIELVAFRDRFPYMRALKKTLAKAIEWDKVIIQLPPGPALKGMIIARSIVKKFTLICDTHTGMIWFRDLRQTLLNGPFFTLLNYCDAVLAHNKENAKFLKARGINNIYVIYDPIPIPIKGRPPPLNLRKKEYILIPAGWDSDEPFDYLITELGNDALASTGFTIVITGDYLRTRYGRKHYRKLTKIRGVILTGYLPYEEYAWLLRNAAAVLGITDSEHIMLRAFWEAAAYYKPVIAPLTRVMFEVMGRYPYYYNTHVQGTLRKAINKLRCDGSKAEYRGLQLGSQLARLSTESLKKLNDLLNRW